MSQRVVLIVDWVAKAGQAHAVRQYLKTMVPLTHQEPGNLQYDVLEDPENENAFVLYEVYKDQAGFEAHCSSDYFKANVLEGALPLLEKRERRILHPAKGV
ncbi:hypothetical protein BZG36_03678 [Bifiguratus adelaidae]|uniref:ABM domain-containing protein n=1 Tax=Bifiguratus adelaidae TaxID=1938954 RepID=A0A261XZQ3_9FUNG|nr:hypothetical protein BZG36_03678 [Bifiguratus adelaidae]